MSGREVATARGTSCRVREWGSGREGTPVLYLHGAAGLQDDEPLLDRLGERFRVVAPEWPGYGGSTGEDLLHDMLDFALHGWDLVEALGLGRPHLVGHSMGGMIAAEMACLAARDVDRLVLVSAAGLWLDEHPVPDLFATLPYELPELLFADPEVGARVLRGTDLADDEALTQFLIGNARRLGTAGKILFPIPDRRTSDRLYRVQAPALVAWGEGDRFMHPAYADRWLELLPEAEVVRIPGAGHMVPYEQPDALAEAVARFLAPS